MVPRLEAVVAVEAGSPALEAVGLGGDDKAVGAEVWGGGGVLGGVSAETEEKGMRRDILG